MASLHRTSGGTYHIRFRIQGRPFHRSLGTTDIKDAKQQKAIVERTLRLMTEGMVTIGQHATEEQVWQLLRSGGKTANQTVVLKRATLQSVCESYESSFSETSKEDSTLSTERKHLRHFQRILGKRKPVANITAAEIRVYVAKRQKEPGTHDRNVRPETIRKELQTLRQLWQFAKVEGYVTGDNPVSQIKRPRSSQKLPFMTWEEIQQRVRRGGLTDGQVAELWECLFLREEEISELLRHAQVASRTLARCPYIFPALAFCAYTGARRSEMFRCLIDDVGAGRVILREKKSTQEQCITFRQIPLHAELESILVDWLHEHPGGQHMFCKNNHNALDDKTARDALKSVKRNSKWEVLRGFHVLRHSFCSNLARHGVDQYKIDELMGHQTEEQRKRYKHLFPEDRKSAVDVLSFNRPVEPKLRVVGT